ncbi:hypothetical protein Taro_005147, partial [Colocasia esculenta]|nr:hypothetical protein [Colocasia esculenta]
DDPLRASGGGTEEVDEDFSQNPWLCALDFLGGSGDASLPHPISSVKSLGSASRVPKLMGIVKSCKPNGLGDLFVTLKDPTGTIGASVHRKVLTEGNLGGDLSVGCVLILKQVSRLKPETVHIQLSYVQISCKKRWLYYRSANAMEVAFFSPRRSIVYLNITLNNVDKFFGKDSGSPKRHTLPTLNAKHPPPGKSLVDEMEPVGRSCFLSQESQRCEVGSQSGLAASRTADGGNMERHGCVQACDGEVVKSIYSKRTLDDMQIEHLSGSSMCTSKAVVGFRDVPRASLVRPGADNIYDEEIIQHSNLKGRVDNGTTETPGRRKGGMNAASDPSSLGWGMAPNEEADQVAVEQCGSSSNMVVGCGEDEGPTDYLLCKTSSTSLSNPMLSKPPERVTEPKSMISKVPLAQWTDEQLSELFCDYQDDTDFF